MLGFESEGQLLRCLGIHSVYTRIGKAGAILSVHQSWVNDMFTRYTLVYFPCTDGAVHVLSQSSIMAHSWLSHSSLMNLSWPAHGSLMAFSWLPHVLLMAFMAPSSLTWALSVLLVPSPIRGSSIVRFECTAEVAEDYCPAKKRYICSRRRDHLPFLK